MTTPSPDRPQPRRVRGGNGQFTRSVDTAQRDAEAARLRSDGQTYQAIADRLGFGDPSTARASVERALAAVIQEPAGELRTLELDRLDRMYREVLAVLEREHVTVSNGKVVSKIVGYEVDGDGNERRRSDGDRIPIWEIVLDDAPVLAAVDRLLKIQDRRARLLGLDAETKVNLSGGVSYEVIGVDPAALR